MRAIWEWFIAQGRKYTAGAFATAVLLIGFVFVALTGLGTEAFPGFATAVVAVYAAFSGGNAAATLAHKKAEEP